MSQGANTSQNVATAGDQDACEPVSRRSLLRRAALLVGIGDVGALAAPAVASATDRTGHYTGNGSTTQVNPGLTSLRGLWVVQVAARGPAVEAFTTNAIQSAFGTGTFLLGGRKESGLHIEAGTFTVTHPRLNQPGVLYHWLAVGD